jgi:hypothetical protein
MFPANPIDVFVFIKAPNSADNKWKAPLWQAAKGAAKKAPK